MKDEFATDDALFTALKQQNATALSVLFHRHGRLVYGLAYKILVNSQEAEDLTQEIFLSLWRNANKSPDCRFFVRYLVTLTKSRAIDKLRAKGRHLRRVDRWGQQMKVDSSVQITPVEQAVRLERAEHVRQALEQLSAKQRQVIELAYDQGLSQSEIAQKLELPLGTVKTSTRQGLLKLKSILIVREGLSDE